MLSRDARDRLKARLNEVHEWPSVYMFKFILEPENDRLDAVLALFPPESEVLRKYSAGGRYLSVTVKEVMLCAEDVVDRYERASAIQGVIAL
jgi:putative lipoic acid-binding regulatory protein